MSDYKLTGDFYHKRKFSGMVLYVEVNVRHFNIDSPIGPFDYTETTYKKASERDVIELVKLLETKKLK